MVITALLLECLKPSANLARLHRMCGSRAELSRAGISRSQGSAERGTVAARAIAARSLALLPIATADPCSWGGEISSRKRIFRRQKFVLETLIFVGRLCKTCVSSGYKILG